MKEQTLIFGRDGNLIGTVTVPSGAMQPTGVVLLNAGAIHRLGPHRVNVRLARDLATRGIASIRFDLAGHGDSGRPSGAKPFAEQAVCDIRDAMDALTDATGLREFAAFGICSGAYHAFGTALIDQRLVALILFDAFAYPTAKTTLLHYLRGLGQPHRLRRFTQLCARLANSATNDATRNSRAPRPESEVARLGVIEVIPRKEDIGHGFKTLQDRGVKLFVLYSGTAIRAYNYTNQFHDTFKAFGVDKRIRVDFRPDVDHQFTVIADQRRIIRDITTWTVNLTGAASSHPAAD